MKLLRNCVLCSILMAGSAVYAQTDSVAKPGSNFSTTRSRMSWMGSNYRKEWNTPVKAPMFYVSKEKGGLKPTKMGGGKQTKSLRLEDKNGREYNLRSIQKFVTAKTLPADLQSELAVDLVADGVSASYPYAALSVIPLAEAAGVPYLKAKLVYVADDPALGEYRSEFAGTLATFEERFPESVAKGWDSEEVLEKLEDDNDHRIDQKGLLTARILDMFVMDFDRHEGQWVWGARDNANGKGKTYFAIPKDRDQAFYINRGTLPRIIKGRSLVPQLEGFKVEANSIERFNFAARNFDRAFLNELTESDWRSAAEAFVAKMTDAVIDRAVAAQPAEIRDISGPFIAQTLKERRNFLVGEVMEYYNFLSETVTITGSDQRELFNVNRNDDGSTTVTVYEMDKDGNQGNKMYERSFNPLVTKELRLFGFDGEDRFVTTGRNDKIKLRVIGGGEADVFQNSDNSQGGMIVYDKLDQNNTLEGKISNRMSNDSNVNKYEFVNYNYPYQSIFVNLGFNPDDGVFLGPTFKYIRHGFRKHPFKSSHEIKALYAFSTKAVNLSLLSQFIGVFGDRTDLVLDLEYRGPNGTTNFFGYGMTSVYDETKPGRFRYYRIRYDLGDVSLMGRHRFSDKVSILFGPTFQWYNMDSTDKFNSVRNVKENTAASGLMPNVFQKQSYVGGEFQFIVDTRDHPVMAERGVNWVNSVRRLTGLNDNSYDAVTQLNTAFTLYGQLIPNRLVLANRIGGGVTFETDGFEFFQAQYLGTEDNLRGYRKFRFAGKSKIFNQTELRVRLSDFRTYLFNRAWGLFGFLDAGRVFVENDDDDGLATGYGGGLWIAPLRRIVLTAAFAMSKEDKMPLVSLGWKF